MTVIALLPYLLLMTFLFAIPTVQMLSRSFLEPSLNFKQFDVALNEPLYTQVFWTTLRISLIVTALSALLAFPVASFCVRTTPLIRNIVFAIVLIPFWTSLLVRVYGWTFLLQRTGVVNQLLMQFGFTSRPLPMMYNEGAVVLGVTHYMLPFMIFSLYASLKAIDPRLAPAAETMGARPLRIFRTVTLPLAAPGLIAGSILVFVGSIGFFVTPALMGGPSEMMVANLITFQVKEALNWPLASALALFLIIAVMTLSWLYFRLADRGAQQGPLT